MLSCYIIDDEAPAVSLLTTFVNKVPFLKLMGSTTNALSAYADFKNYKIDLLFLDIQMPDISGIEFLQSLDERPMLIFTTAFEEYALQGYDLDIVDYLLKPIPFQRFLKAANKALKLHDAATDRETADEFLFIKSEYKNKRILMDDIRYIEGLKDYVKIHTNGGMEMTRMNLKGITRLLPANKFQRIHRSYIVNLSHIISYQKGHVQVQQQQLPIGESYRTALIAALEK